MEQNGTQQPFVWLVILCVFWQKLKAKKSQQKSWLTKALHTAFKPTDNATKSTFRMFCYFYSSVNCYTKKSINECCQHCIFTLNAIFFYQPLHCVLASYTLAWRAENPKITGSLRIVQFKTNSYIKIKNSLSVFLDFLESPLMAPHGPQPPLLKPLY